MNTLFTQISEVVPKLQGWCSVQKAHALAASVITLRPKITVEIGVFGGRSLIPMALAHKAIGKGLVIGIDPWKPDASAAGQSAANAEWWKNLDHYAVFTEFIRRLEYLDISHCIHIHKLTSDEVNPPDVIDLLHVDGNHSDQAVRDVQRFASNVRVGGLCFADDIDWEGGGVARAVQKLKELGFVQLYTLDTGAMFQRVK